MNVHMTIDYTSLQLFKSLFHNVQFGCVGRTSAYPKFKLDDVTPWTQEVN